MAERTTKQVFEEEGCSKFVAVEWAENNGVKKFGYAYRWTEKNFQKFKARNKRRGRPSVR